MSRQYDGEARGAMNGRVHEVMDLFAFGVEVEVECYFALGDTAAVRQRADNETLEYRTVALSAKRYDLRYGGYDGVD